MNQLVAQAIEIAKLAAEAALEAQDVDASFEFKLAIAQDTMENLENLPAPLGDCFERALDLVLERQDSLL